MNGNMLDLSQRLQILRIITRGKVSLKLIADKCGCSVPALSLVIHGKTTSARLTKAIEDAVKEWWFLLDLHIDYTLDRIILFHPKNQEGLCPTTKRALVKGSKKRRTK